tara:strand:- start:440 stop:655 length:216 start_codon:yes stop_codon:yes gene_type:complete
MKQYSVTILWGESADIDDEPVTYKFENEAEKRSFLLGVGEASGWLDWRTIGESNSDYQTIDEYRTYIKEQS